MKTKSIIQRILIFLILIQLVSSTTVQIEMKDSFSTGEEVSFNYTFLSDTSSEIEYSVFVNCPYSPLPLLEIKNTTLKKDILFTQKYIYLDSVHEQIEPQTCTAFVSILSPEEIEKEKTFEIITTPSFEFNLFSCQDELCFKKSKVFVKGENIFLNYESDIPNLILNGNLIYPDGTEKEIDIPSSMKADNVGSYELEITASKEGYKSIIKNLQFGVIEKEASIKEVDLSEDEIFYGKRIGGDKENNFWDYLIYFFIILLIVLFVVFFKFVLLPMLKKKK